MQTIQKLKILRAKSLTAGMLTLAVLLLSGITATGTVHADPPNSVLATVKYCKAHTPDKLEKTICTEKNMNRIRAAVQDKCKKEKGNDKDACIEQASEGVIQKVAKKDPKNEEDAKHALDAAIAGGDDADENKDAADKCAGSVCAITPTGQGKNCDDHHCDLVGLYVNPAIQLLSITVGLVVAASLIMGAIQYTASSGDPQKTGAAKSRIQNTLLAFMAYAFFYAFLNFLIPGGLFK